MRGSYEWAMLRLAILAVFVIPAALMSHGESSRLQTGYSYSWLAAVDVAEPVLALHQPATQPVPQLSQSMVEEIRQSAERASQAQQEAMQALRKELARELVRARTEQAQRNAKS